MILFISLNIISIVLITVEGILILKSYTYLKNVAVTSKDFTNVFNTAKEEVTLLFAKIKQLTDITEKKENHMLHTVFYLENLEMYIKKILEKLGK